MKNDNVFPPTIVVMGDSHNKETREKLREILAEGKELSMRDWFAGQYLAGLAANDKAIGTPFEWAQEAYAQADAMLAERERGEKK